MGVGYARVSIQDQNLSLQLDDLKKLSEREEAGEQLRFKVAPGKLMQLIRLLNLQYISYRVEFPAKS